MGMVKQILTPGVKNGKETDCGAEMLRIGSNGLERFGGSPEENAVNGSFVFESDVGDLFGHGKDDMKILGLQNLGLPVFDPFGAGQGLAFWTVAVRTRVEPNALLTAPVTHFEVTAESGRAACFNRGHDAALCRG
jgi:hypothetical protein